MPAPVRHSDYLAWIKRRPCCRCGAPGPSDVAHVRAAASPKTGDLLPRRHGIAYWCVVPLCRACHMTAPDSIHRVGEDRFFLAFGRGVGHGARLVVRYLAEYVAGLETGAPML